jgi:hypothetical protein
MLFIALHLRGGKWGHILALAIAAYATYTKEPVFGIFLGIAIINLTFKTKLAPKWFNWALIINGAVFLVLYYFITFRNSGYVHIYGTPFQEGKFNLNYGAYHGSIFDLIRIVLLRDKSLILVLALGMVRVFAVLRGKNEIRAAYDAPLFSALAYAGFLISHKLVYSYYFFPVIILCTPVMYYWMSRPSRGGGFLKAAVLAAAISNFGGCAQYIGSTIKDRKAYQARWEEIIAEAKNGKKVVLLEDMSSLGFWRLHSYFAHVANIEPKVVRPANVYDCIPGDIILSPWRSEPLHNLMMSCQMDYVGYISPHKAEMYRRI